VARRKEEGINRRKQKEGGPIKENPGYSPEVIGLNSNLMLHKTLLA